MQVIIAASILAGCVVAWLLFHLFFSDVEDLVESVRFWITPDIISALRGEWAEDQWAETKLFVYLAIPVGVGFATYFGLQKAFA